MVTENLLEALKEKQKEQGLSLRKLGLEIEVTQPLLSMLFAGKRPLTAGTHRRIQRFLKAKPSATLAATLDSFIASGVHTSAKTVETLRERLTPFGDYLALSGIHDPLDIAREHVEGFLKHIGKGRRGSPLNPASMHGFTKDVKAFVNYIADALAPEDWRNPVKKLHLGQPQVTIRPLAQGQVDRLLALAAETPSNILKARNKAMLYILLDGALRISELLTATRYQLADDGILRVNGKGNKEREVALAPGTLQVLGEYMALRQDTSPFLIVTEDGRPMDYEGVKSMFQRWRRAAPGAFQGVRLSAHTLRHTSATMRRIAGMSEGDLQTFLGHSSPVMTRHYSAFALARSANAAALRTSPVEALFPSAGKDGDRAN